MTLSTVESALIMSVKIINRLRHGPLFLIALLVAGCLQSPQNGEPDPVEAFKAGFSGVYAEHCAQCHGGQLEGTALGVALVGAELAHGSSIDAIAANIATGFPATGMPAWSSTLSPGQMRSLAIFIAEQRVGLRIDDAKVGTSFSLPVGVVASELHDFRVELVTADIDPYPFSMHPLRDGRILLTEKLRGLKVVDLNGTVSELIAGAPRGHADLDSIPIGMPQGVGWVLDVLPHPDYENNGWIYLAFGDRCDDCNEVSRTTGKPVSMNKIVRGRLNGNTWVDEEVIWSVDKRYYSRYPDTGTGGRLTFDTSGHLFFSVGMKGAQEHIGMQNLSTPYGKIHRIRDDGSIPADNPFVNTPDAMSSIWSYGHRNPQGLDYDPVTDRLWSSELGPRGGDEINLIRPGRNYGWPLVSSGVNYDGSAVDFAAELGITFDPVALEPPVVDLTPSPAVSSIVIYNGDRLPNWSGNLLVATLKSTELYRFVTDGDEVVHKEILLKNLARIRDIETGPDGAIYLLLEHKDGGQIIRLVPA